MNQAKERLRFLFITPWYPTTGNPVEGIFVHEFCQRMARRADVKVIALSIDDRIPASASRTTKEVYDGVETIRFVQGKGSVPRFRYLGRLAGQMAQLRRVIAAFHPDIIHATTYHAAIPATIIGRKLRIPVVAAEHYSGFYRGMVKGIEGLKARWALGRAECVFVVSQYLRKLLEGHRVKAPMEIVPIGVDPDLFHLNKYNPPVNRPYYGIMVASLVAIKGHCHLLEAVSILITRGKDLVIDVIGEGPERRRLEQQARSLNLNGAIIFHGALSKPDVARMMQKADFAVSSSLGETFGASIAEGLAVGLPTVATNAGAIPELIDSGRGVLVEPGDAEALADGMEELMGRLSEFDRAAISRWSLERFDHNSVTERIEAICRGIVANYSQRIRSNQ